jgi:hypothetical protein
MSSANTCPVCRQRKAKRLCPALNQTICTVCCATKREVEIRCPADCPYLSSARSHPPAVIQRRQERDLTFMLPTLADLNEAQYQLVILFQSITLKHAQAAVPALLDHDVAAGAAAAASTLETARKGIIYEHQAVSVPAQRLSAEYARVVAELAKQTGSQPRLERDAATALRRIEQGASAAATALSGDEPPVYLRLLGRMLNERGQSEESPASPAPGSSGLIIPG